MTYFLKWWLVFSVILTTVFVLWYSGLIWVVIAADITFISIGILSLLIGTSIKLGYDFWKLLNEEENFYFDNYLFIADTMTMLGFAGTLIGMLLLLDPTTVAAVFSSDIANTKIAMSKVMIGIGSAVYTTLFGLIANWLIKLQLRIVERSQED